MTGAPVSVDMLGLTARIVSAHVGNNAIDTAELPALISEVFKALSAVGQDVQEPAPAAPASDRRQPAVPVKKSVFAEYIVCLEDGKKLKMLKRHLKTAYDMTPDQYRERWGLAQDYPMVAPSYANHRSELAKRIGLGTKARSSHKP